MERFVQLFALCALISVPPLLILLFYWRWKWGKRAVKRNREFKCAKCAKKLSENDEIFIKSIERSKHPSAALDWGSKYVLANYNFSLKKSTFHSADMGEIVVKEPIFGLFRIPHRRMRIILCAQCGGRKE
jgi:predicted nucleic-acid-binding Zn-ribbon protein